MEHILKTDEGFYLTKYENDDIASTEPTLSLDLTKLTDGYLSDNAVNALTLSGKLNTGFWPVVALDKIFYEGSSSQSIDLGANQTALYISRSSGMFPLPSYVLYKTANDTSDPWKYVTKFPLPSCTIFYVKSEGHFYVSNFAGNAVEKVPLSQVKQTISTGSGTSVYSVRPGCHNILNLSTSSAQISLNDSNGNNDYVIEFNRENVISSGCQSMTFPSSVEFEDGIKPDMSDFTLKKYKYGLVTIKNGHTATYSKFGSPVINGTITLTDDTEVQLWGDSNSISSSDMSPYVNTAKSVVVSDTVASIGQSAFLSCSALEKVEFTSSVPPTLLTGSLSGNFEIWVPDSEVEAYASAWSSYTDRIMQLKVTLTLTDDTTVDVYDAYSNKDLTKPSGSGSLKVPLISDYRDIVKEATVYYPAVTAVGGNAFMVCSSLTSVTLPDEITSFGASAFASSISLANLNIPSSLTTIGAAAFQATALTSITIPSGVTVIPNYAFFNCDNLSTIVLPAGITRIGSSSLRAGSRESTLAITCMATVPPTLSQGALPDTNFTVYVPADSVDAYKAADVWSDYANFITAM